MQLNELLALKQQQMGVVEARLEAREAAQQGRETVRHGRTIMLFTVVTIIFVSSNKLVSDATSLINAIDAALIRSQHFWYECCGVQ
jgi:hypothetical protein